MYVILTYDFNEKRVQKALKICRKYLKWVQNSVFEGELTWAKLEKLKWELKNLMKDNEDSVRIYIFENKKCFSTNVMGLEKGEVYDFL